MSNMRWVAALLLALTFVAPAPRALGQEEEAVTVYRQVSPAVVSLQNAEGSGTGILISTDGLILTNAHVVTSPLPFEARVDIAEGGGKTHEVVFKKVDLIGLHPKLDLALVRIDPAEHRVRLPAAQVARSKAQPGQRVYVIGNPAAGKTILTKSITSGMLSAADREIPDEPGRYYQIDAAINPGNSGGPLCDRSGKVLGLVTFKFTEASALGFAIPLNDQDLTRKAFVPPSRRAGDPKRAAELMKIADKYADLGQEALRREGVDGETHKILDAYAAICYRTALTYDPANADLYYNIGMLLRSMDEDDAATGYLLRGIQLKPWGKTGGQGNADAYRELGFALVKQKKDAPALTAWGEGVAKFPYAAKVWEDLAIHYIQHDRPAEAAEAAQITLLLADRGTRVSVMESLTRDARTAAARQGERATADLESRVQRKAMVAKLDKLLAASNAARRARKIYVTDAFARLVKEIGGPAVEGAEQTIPQQPRERLAELGEAGTATASTSVPTPGATAKSTKPANGDGWLGGAEPKDDPKKPAAPEKTASRSATDAGGGWIGSDTPAPRAQGIKPVAVSQPLAGKSQTVVDATVTRIDVKDVVGAVWTKDAKAVVFLQKEGLLRRVRLPDFVEERQVHIDSPCGSLATSKEGLVVAVTGLQELWLFDETTLDLKRHVTVSAIGRTVSGPASSIAIASNGSGGVSLINLASGQTMSQITPRDVQDQRGPGAHARFGFGLFAITPDGKYLLTEGDECIHRLRVDGKRLIYEEGGPRIGSNPQAMIVSPDGRYVCLPSGGGNGNIPGQGPMPYTTFVYPVTDLQKPVIMIGSGAYPRTFAFDVAAKQLYAQNYNTQLIVFSPTGLRGKEYALRDAGEPRLLLVHPAGKKILFIGGPVYWFELP